MIIRGTLMVRNLEYTHVHRYLFTYIIIDAVNEIQ